MPKKSAGLLLYKYEHTQLLVLLVHPGGPFWKNKDAGAWSIPKGEYTEDESPLHAAIRETEEEIGLKVDGEFIELSPVKLKSGKIIHAWAVEQEFTIEDLASNFFEMEWPPKSGAMQSFAEVDKAGWFTLEEAKEKINSGQWPLLVDLENKINK